MNLKLKKKGNSQLAYLRTFAEEDGAFSLVDVSITLRRRSLFYTFNFVVPSVFLTILSISGFILPPECGEKIGLRMYNNFQYFLFGSMTLPHEKIDNHKKKKVA
jgi:hypothetical protein